MRYLFIISMSLIFCRLYTMEQLVVKPLVTFAFERHQKWGYQLKVDTPHGSLRVDFHPVENVAPAYPFYAYAQLASQKVVIDLWPVNGKSTMPVDELFSKKVLRELGSQAGTASTICENQLCLFVLDLKDEASRYRNRSAISSAESRIRDLLLTQKPQRAINNRIKLHNLRFFLREGLLKATLIQEVLTSEQVTLFDSPGQVNKPGRDAFCMLCEILMNGFKSGYEIHITNGIKAYNLQPYDFFEYACPSNDAGLLPPPNFKKLCLLRLYTLYSPAYKETYALTSTYYQALRQFFKTKHLLDGNMITHISVESQYTLKESEDIDSLQNSEAD